MTVAATSNRVSYAGNGITTAFSTSPVVFFNTSDLQVYLTNTATQVSTLQTLTTQYSVSGGGGATGTVTMVTAPPSGYTLVILRSLPLTQPTDLVNNSINDAEVTEAAFDWVTFQIQQLDERIDRTLQLSPGSTLTGSELPAPDANKYLRWNATGDALVNANILAAGTVVTTAFTDTLLDDSTSNAFLTTLTATRGETGAAAETVLDKLRERATFGDFGAAGDGTTDDSTAVTNAFASGLRLDGLGKTYAVSGNFTLPDNCYLENAAFKQLTPNNSSRRTLTKTSGTGNMTLRNVKIDKNGATTDGTIADAAGIWLANIDNVTLDNVEVTGNSKGTGLFLSTGSRYRVINCYIHDMRWTNGSDPGTEQIVGLWLNALTDVDVIAPRIRNLDGQIGASPVRAYQTDAITVGGCSNFRIIGGELENCGEGIDITGTSGNSRFSVLGTHARDMDSYGFKAANSASDGLFIGCTAFKCGLTGFLVSGAASSGLPRCEDIAFIGCKARDIGSNGNWSGSNVAGFAVLVGSFDTFLPAGVRFIECDAIDEQGTGTMKYGFRNEVTVSASNIRTNSMWGCHVDGATVADTLGQIGDYVVRAQRTANQAIPNDASTVIAWDNEIEDPYSIHSAGTVTVRESGRYRITAHGEFAANATGIRIITLKSGGATLSRSTGVASAATAQTFECNWEGRITKDSTITVEAYQNSGGNLDLVSGVLSHLIVRKVYGRE